MSFKEEEEKDKDREKIRAGWVFDEKSGRYVPPKTEKFTPHKTTDPDYYADSILMEIKSVQDSVIECFRDLKKQLTVIEGHLVTIKKRVRKK